MIKIRKSKERGHFNFGWLDTFHTFSFGEYHDPAHMGFRTLRVINEDVIAPGEGFPTHGHRDMEIITYIISGELAHRDSLGNQETIRAGEFQRMTVGSGIRHSEFNASKTEPCHLLQIWIIPAENDLKPGYEQKSFPANTQENLQLVVSPEPNKKSLMLHQDAKLYVGNLSKKGEKIDYALGSNRNAWIQLVRGSLSANGKNLEAGDGAAISSENKLLIEAVTPCEFLLFDLA